MNFYLVPGDNEDPLTHLAISANGGSCLVATSRGGIYRYGIDGNPIEELQRPKKYQCISGLAFSGSSADALAIGMSAPETGDILRILGAGGIEVLYEGAPFRFGGMAIAGDGSFALLAGGGELLRWFPEQRSYLPIDSPEGIVLRGIAFAASRHDALVVGGARSGGYVGAYSPGSGTGKLELLESGPLPTMETVAWDCAGERAFAAGQTGSVAWYERGKPLRQLPGPKAVVVHAAAFHPREDWVLVATGPAGASERGSELLSFSPASGTFSTLYEGPAGAGAFLSAAILPSGDRALVGTEWGQILELSL